MTDPLGSVIALTDGSGDAAINRYDEYGVPQSGNTGRFGYAGALNLGLAGQAPWHMRNRQYHPGLGRFLQTDPIGIAGGVNLYAYVGGDPVNLVDPFGLQNMPWLDTTVVCQRVSCRHSRGYGGASVMTPSPGIMWEGVAPDVVITGSRRRSLWDRIRLAACAIPPFSIGFGGDGYAGVGVSASVNLNIDIATGQIGIGAQAGVGIGGGVNAGVQAGLLERNARGYASVGVGVSSGVDLWAGVVSGGTITADFLGTDTGPSGSVNVDPRGRVEFGGGTPTAFVNGQVNGNVMTPSIWDPGC